MDGWMDFLKLPFTISSTHPDLAPCSGQNKTQGAASYACLLPSPRARCIGAGQQAGHVHARARRKGPVSFHDAAGEQPGSVRLWRGEVWTVHLWVSRVGSHVHDSAGYQPAWCSEHMDSASCVCGCGCVSASRMCMLRRGTAGSGVEDLGRVMAASSRMLLGVVVAMSGG
eukprot:359490-Chlamydomonas_euryale.AAC.3